MDRPVLVALAVALGFPLLAMFALIAFNPGIVPGAFSNAVTLLVVLGFVVAAVFEIKRLADQSSDRD
jgi:hypothetical protein